MYMTIFQLIIEFFSLQHIFCESCVSVWFDREKTCPMCRTQIHAENPQWKDGSTSVHIQWY